jgi:hypothetical protein
MLKICTALAILVAFTAFFATAFAQRACYDDRNCVAHIKPNHNIPCRTCLRGQGSSWNNGPGTECIKRVGQCPNLRQSK